MMLFKTLLTSNSSVKKIVKQVQYRVSPQQNDLALRNLSRMVKNKDSDLSKLTNKALEYKNNLPFGCIDRLWVKVSSFKQ